MNGNTLTTEQRLRALNKAIRAEMREREVAHAEETERLREVLQRIADPSYVGNYAPLEVIEIYRKWAANALGRASA